MWFLNEIIKLKDRLVVRLTLYLEQLKELVCNAKWKCWFQVPKCIDMTNLTSSVPSLSNYVVTPGPRRGRQTGSSTKRQDPRIPILPRSTFISPWLSYTPILPTEESWSLLQMKHNTSVCPWNVSRALLIVFIYIIGRAHWSVSYPSPIPAFLYLDIYSVI